MYRLTLINIFIIITLTAIMLNTKYQIQRASKTMHHNMMQLEAIKNEQRVLKAEYHYLLHPKRIERLTKEHLNLRPETLTDINKKYSQ